MSFLTRIFSRLGECGPRTVLQEGPSGPATSATELLDQVARARTFLVQRGLQPGQRCALLAANSVRWIALDLALMAEGIIVVPLYSRQSPAELATIVADCSPALICAEQRGEWCQDYPVASLDEAFAPEGKPTAPISFVETDPVTLIYTSGTSGNPKGVILHRAGIGHVLSCTCARLDELRAGRQGPDRVFHYLPFAFAGSWIMLMSCLLRGSLLVMNMDLGEVARDIACTRADYFMNVPVLLDRLRQGVLQKGWLIQRCFAEVFPWSLLGRVLLFPLLRRRLLGPRLQALVCGSAPLNPETQRFFALLGVPVLQVYGLTETTAICTMDPLQGGKAGHVGRAIPGVEMRCAEDGEILVRGPNLLGGYWNDDRAALHDGWFATGDQGEVDADGHWRIVGRLKNLLVLSSAHKVAPEPLEARLLERLPRAEHVVLIGDERPYLSVLVSGPVQPGEVQSALDMLNPQLPHYQQIRRFALAPLSFSADNGLLTANGKLKRGPIGAHLREQIEILYR